MAPAHAPDHGGYDKAVLLVGDDHRDLLADGVMVRAIVIAKVGPSGIALRPASAIEVLMALAPTTLFQLPGAGKEALQAMSAMVQNVPGYWLEVGPDLDGWSAQSAVCSPTGSGSMWKDHRLLSVVVPTYNRASFLSEAVASIRMQRYEPLEIIVVDDGSSDRTADVVGALAGPDLDYIRQENRGPAAASKVRLAAAAMSSASSMPTTFGRHTSSSDSSRCSPQIRRRTSFMAAPRPGVLVEVAADGPTRFEQFAEPWYATQLGSALYRSEIFARVGGFDPGPGTSEDFDWLLRAREGGANVVRTPETALLYRW